MTRFLSWFLFALCLALPVRAQDPVQQPETSPAAIQARIDAVATDDTLAAELKTALTDALKKALESAKAAEKSAATLKNWNTLRESAPTRLAADKQALEALANGAPIDLTGKAIPELEQALQAAQQKQAEQAQRTLDLDKEATRRADRRTAVPAAIADLRAQLQALPATLPDAPDADPRLLAANRTALQTQRLRLQAELDALAAELPTYDAEAEWMRAERDLAARTATVEKGKADAIQAALQPLREAAAKQAQEEARQKALAAELAADPNLRRLADENQALATELTLVTGKITNAQRDQAAPAADLDEVTSDFQEMKAVAEQVGPTPAVGTLLRQKLARIDEISRAHRQRTKNRTEQIQDALLKGLEHDQRRARLNADPEGWLQQQLGESVPSANVRNQARSLRDARLDLLDKLARGYDTLFKALSSMQTAERDLTAKVTECRTFVTERVFGIRSSEPIWRTDWRNAATAAAWLVAVDSWQTAGLAIYDSLVEPIWPLVLLVPLLLLLVLRPWTGRALFAAGEAAARGSNVAYSPTAWAAVHTTIYVVPLPVLLWACGSWIGAHEDLSPFVKGLAGALRHTALFLLLAIGLSAMVRPKGLAEAHFRWQSTTLLRLRSNLKLLFAAVPIVFALSMLEAANDPRNFLGTLGKPLLLGELLLLTILLYRLMHPTTGIIGGAVQVTSAALHRFRTLFFVLAVGTALLLLTMAALGYDYTALQLLRRLLLTIGVVVASVFVHAMILRRLLLERRRLQILQAKERMEAAKAGDTTATGTSELPIPEAIDPRNLAERTQALLRWAITAGFLAVTFQIWVDVLPALGILRTVTLWNVGTPEAPELLTLADLLLAVFLLAIVGVAARNGPALLELLVLQRLRLQAGTRHGITTLVRYGILITGAIFVFHAVGVGWSKVQWLVAAMSVGLGFGLQEIFANFVSGLILLLEQPVRVGDIVSVGTTTGRVTRIQIRATTIQDWERKELVVPNREFVTGTFVNWTLGDSVVRWTIPVGIAYGSDTQKALDLLEEVARKSRFVLTDPKPEAVFLNFGDSTLDLNLRIFVDMNALEYRWMTEVLQGIDAAFAAAGIEIAFPQRDVNLKLSAPTAELLRRDRPDGPGTVVTPR